MQKAQDRKPPRQGSGKAMVAPNMPAEEAPGSAAEKNTNHPGMHSPSDHYVAGIGASAGGFEALEQFFMAMPPDNDMAFVVVQHLSPGHKSLMAELLSKHTPMHIEQASDGMSVHANCIYLIPPGKIMTIAQGRLHLASKGETQAENYPIDIFLHSLAEDAGERAIAIILSGTGSDGTRGIRSVKEQGGMLMVQDAASAKFDGMPASAIATGLVDYVLPPSAMPEELQRYMKHPFVASQREGLEGQNSDDTQFARIFSVLKTHTGIDFSWYKINTVSRRIERRLSVNQIDTLADYVTYLHQNPNEVSVLYKELLIGVTRFFRDPEAFRLLQENIIPKIFSKKRPRAPVRVWVAGCSTGEEAYSMAILFNDYIVANSLQHEVKIFATDVDEQALDFASAGVYPESVAADMSAAQFRNYFMKKDQGYQVSSTIREMVIFAQHNIIRDPPFNKIDLISCRNMLIYLQPAIQKKVMLHFNFGLVEDGFLFLGASETIGSFANLYSVFDTKWKIYQSKGRHMPMHMEQFSLSPVPRPLRQSAPVTKEAKPQLERVDSAQAGAQPQSLSPAFFNLYQHFIPPNVVISERFEVLHVMGDVSPFMRLKSGAITLHVTQLVREDLALTLETGVNKARRSGKEMVYANIFLPGEGETLCINMHIVPFRNGDSTEELFCIFFEPIKSPFMHEEDDSQTVCHGDDAHRIRDLEHELQFSRETLHATIEELETTNEELQVANEEMLSSNEELQSSNEELQSVNEELITVNSEYQGKIQELTDLNNDVNNLLTSTSVGTIFLDLQLYIRKFTPAITKFINLWDTDIGRKITHITLTMNYDSIKQDCEEVLRSRAPIEREAPSHDGGWTLLRIHPYRTEEGAVKGLVLNFIDISTIKSTNAELQKLTMAVELSPSIVVIMDGDGKVEYVNKQYSDATGYSLDDVRSKTLAELQSGRVVHVHEHSVSPAYQDKEVEEDICGQAELEGHWNGTLQSTRKDGSLYLERATVVPIRGESDELLSFLMVSRDVTEELTLKRAAAAHQARLEALLDRGGAGFVEMNSKYQVVWASPGFYASWGCSPEKAQQATIWELFPQPLQASLAKQFREAVDNGQHAFTFHVPASAANVAPAVQGEMTADIIRFGSAPALLPGVLPPEEEEKGSIAVRFLPACATTT